eukprot:6226386-Amphidinium_carterae.1
MQGEINTSNLGDRGEGGERNGDSARSRLPEHSLRPRISLRLDAAHSISVSSVSYLLLSQLLVILQKLKLLLFKHIITQQVDQWKGKVRRSPNHSMAFPCNHLDGLAV